jgi:hypothetical protein
VKLHLVSVPLVFLLACGGTTTKKHVTVVKPMPAARPVVKKPPPPPEPPPPPPPPMEWHATVRLEPVKGVRMPGFEIAFVQVEGEATRARTTAAIDKLKAGSYHLVVHDGSECGKKGEKVGAALIDLSADALLVAKKKELPSLDVESGALPLDGDSSIVGHAVVLHADKRGKLGKAVACGLVVSQGSSGGAGDAADSGGALD